MFDKIKNYKLHDETITMLYGSIISVTCLVISIAYKNINFI